MWAAGRGRYMDVAKILQMDQSYASKYRSETAKSKK